MREIGETGIKLIGVYFAASAVAAIAGLVASLALPLAEGFSPLELFRASVLQILGLLLVAGICLVGGRAIAGEFFPDEALHISGLSRQDLLLVGIVLLGLALALDGIPSTLRILGEALWYAENDRQPFFWAAMRNRWQLLADSGLSILVGGITSGLAGKIARTLDPVGTT